MLIISESASRLKHSRDKMFVYGNQMFNLKANYNTNYFITNNFKINIIKLCSLTFSEDTAYFQDQRGDSSWTCWNVLEVKRPEVSHLSDMPNTQIAFYSVTLSSRPNSFCISNNCFHKHQLILSIMFASFHAQPLCCQIYNLKQLVFFYFFF